MSKWINKYSRVRSTPASQVNNCTSEKMGSCCYRNKQGKDICKDNISCKHCTDSDLYRGIFSILPCKDRIRSFERGCCNSCKKQPKLKPIIGGSKNSKFRSMVDKRQILPEQQEDLDTNKCELKYKKNIKRCEKCIDSNSVCKKTCLRFAEIMKILCEDSLSAHKKSVTDKLSSELKSYYRCIAKNKEEYINSIKTIFDQYGCLCNNESNQENTKLYKEFETLDVLYSGYEHNCRSLLPKIYTDSLQFKESSLGCCCQYIKENEESEISSVGSRHKKYSSDDLRKCECISYSECISKRAFYDPCWSADCDCTENSCSGRQDSHECSCCQETYTNSPCYKINNTIEDTDFNCWIRVCDKGHCWVRVPAVCDTCEQSWLGVRVGIKVLRQEDISNIKKPECNDGKNKCQQSVVTESSLFKCKDIKGSECSCGDELASIDDTNVCKRLVLDISNSCSGCPRINKEKSKRSSITHRIVSKCCDCTKKLKLKPRSTGVSLPTKTTGSTPSTQISYKSSSASKGSYGY